MNLAFKGKIVDASITEAKIGFTETGFEDLRQRTEAKLYFMFISVVHILSLTLEDSDSKCVYKWNVYKCIAENTQPFTFFHYVHK